MNKYLQYLFVAIGCFISPSTNAQITALGQADVSFPSASASNQLGQGYPYRYVQSCADANGNFYWIFGNTYAANALTIISCSPTGVINTLLPGYTVSFNAAGGGLTNVQPAGIAADASGNLYAAFADASKSGKITVIKYNGTTWSLLGTQGFSGGLANDINMCIDNANIPYVAFVDANNSYKAVVYKYVASAWTSVGAATGISAGTADYLSLQFAAATPYIAYVDGANSNKLSVMSYNGTSWAYVGGSAGISAGGTSFVDMKIYSGAPYVAYQDAANASKSTVLKYNGSSWVALGGAGIGIYSQYSQSLAINNAGTVFLACSDNAVAGYSTVKKFDGTNWVNAAQALVSYDYSLSHSICADANGNLALAQIEINQYSRLELLKYTTTAPYFTPIGITSIGTPTRLGYSMCTKASGQPVIFFSDVNKAQKGTAMIYTGGAWATLGSAGFTPGIFSSSAVACNSTGQVYVAFNDSTLSNGITVMTYNGTTWTNVANASALSSSNAININMVFDASNNLYLFSQEGNLLICRKYNGSTWTSFSPSSTIYNNGSASYLFATLDNNNNPIMVFRDYLNTNKASVIRYSSSSWSYVGAAGISAAGASQFGLCTDATNNIYISYADENASSKVTVLKYNGTAWATLGTAAFSAGSIMASSICADNQSNIWLFYNDKSNGLKSTLAKYNGTTWNTTTYLNSSYGAALNTKVIFNANSGIIMSYINQNLFASIIPYSSNYLSVSSSLFTNATAQTMGATDACPSLAIDPNGPAPVSCFGSDGNYYIAYASWTNSYKITLIKYTLSTAIITYYNTNYIVNSSNVNNLAIANTGSYVAIAFSDAANGNKLSVAYFNPFNSTFTNTWTNLTTGTATNLSCISQYYGSGNTFVAYVDGANSNKISVQWYSTSTSSWSQLGNAAFSPGTSTIIKMWTNFQGNDNIVTVFFRDMANGAKAAAWQYNGSNWVTLGGQTFSPGGITGLSVSFDYINYQPVVAIGDSVSGKNFVYTYNGSIWVAATNNQFTGPTTGKCIYQSIAIDNNNPAVSYLGFSDGGQNGRLTVMSSTGGGTWTVTGTAGFTTDSVAQISLAIDRSGGSTPAPYVCYLDPASGYMLNFAIWNGTSWNVQFKTGGNIASSQYAAACNSNGTPYIFYQDATGKGTLKYFNGNAWNNIGSTSFTSGTVYYPSLAFSPSDMAYIAYADGANANKLTVMSYNGSSWSTLGAAGISAAALSAAPALVIDNTGAVYVAYSDAGSSGKLTVKKYNNSTWSNLGSLGFSNGTASFVNLLLDNSNNPIVAYADNSYSNKLVLQKYSNSAWASVGASTGISLGSVTDISATIDASNTIYVAYSDGAYSLKATVEKYNGSAWSYLGTGISNGRSKYININLNHLNLPCIAYQDGSNYNKIAYQTYSGSAWNAAIPISSQSAGKLFYLNSPWMGYMLFYYTYNMYAQCVPVCYHYFGSTSSDITLATNWFPNISLTQYQSYMLSNVGPYNLIFPSDATNAPNFTANTYQFNANNISAFKSPTINLPSGATINVANNILIAGTRFTKAGKLVLNGSSAQSITCTANPILHQISLQNAAGVTISGNANVDSILQISTGNLTISNTLTFNKNAYIGQSAATTYSITGTITDSMATTNARRAYRFFSHPYKSYISLNQLTTFIDITGTGGSTNGFTNTLSQKASCFWYNPTTGNPVTTNDPLGWIAFTNTTATGVADNNAWKSGQGIRLFIRGTKGQGIYGVAYTPANPNLVFTGTPNMGDQVITLTKGANSGYNLIGNPFLCPINMNSTVRGSSLASSFYVWDPSLSTAGAYTAVAFSSTYVLPPHAAFFLSTSASTNNTITIPESAKVISSANLGFKQTANNSINPNELYLTLTNTYDSIIWDNLQFIFADSTVADSDYYDAPKLFNIQSPSLYSFANNGAKLAIDARPFPADSSMIPLGIDDVAAGNYTFKLKKSTLNPEQKLYFMDRLMQTALAIDADFNYNFSVTADTTTQVSDRFYISTAIPQNYSNPSSINLYPNPVDGTLHIHLNNFGSGNWNWNIYNEQGISCLKGLNYMNGNNAFNINLANLKTGWYTIQLYNEETKLSKSFLKK